MRGLPLPREDLKNPRIEDFKNLRIEDHIELKIVDLATKTRNKENQMLI